MKYLELENMRLENREGMALCSSGFSHLTRLRALKLRGNQLSSRACTILAVIAKSLPKLKTVQTLSVDEQPRVPHERTALLQELNWQGETFSNDIRASRRGCVMATSSCKHVQVVLGTLPGMRSS
jgi:hypothetical protein